MPLDDRAIAISATFTAEAIEPALAFWVRELGLEYAIHFAGYNQLFQELLDPAGLFARNRDGFNIALVRLEDWPGEGNVRRLAEAVHSAAGRFSVPLILVLCPVSRDHQEDLEAALQLLRGETEELASVCVMGPADVLARYPVDDIHDPHGNELGHVPYTPLFFVALATALARRIHALTAPPFKLAALDCDDTLWAGICGEDGPQNVRLDPPRRALQQFMLDRRRSGMLLAICSKNNEEDVLDTFRAHPEMPLRLEHFVSRRINWDSKGANLSSLADELDLGLESFILIDDNPKECTEAASSAPEVLALPLPARVSEIPEFLHHVWAFDRARVTEEDRHRSELYQQRAARATAQRTAPGLDAFLASLELEVAIAPLRASQVARVSQLTQRTNQMNATCVRRTESEIQRLAGAECLTVEVKDRFGSYGLTGVMIFRVDGDALRVDTFLLSCRALGRGVEHRMVAHLGEIARSRGLKVVEIPFVASQRNRPAALFLESLGKLAGDRVLRLPAVQAAVTKYTGGPIAGLPSREEPAPRTSAPRKVNYLRVATELRTPSAIHDAIRASARRAAPSTAADPPRTALERELVDLWKDLLNVPALGIHDNFFELGGHSLLAVQLLSRVRQVHGVDLSLEVVYSGEFTVAELAKAVELKEIERGGADYQDLLQELEGLSDEEVRALLAEEQDAS